MIIITFFFTIFFEVNPSQRDAKILSGTYLLKEKQNKGLHQKFI